MKNEPVMTIISFSSMMDFAVTDKNLLFGGPSIGKMELCVKEKKAATYGALGLLYRSAAYEDGGAGQPKLFND